MEHWMLLLCRYKIDVDVTVKTGLVRPFFVAALFADYDDLVTNTICKTKNKFTGLAALSYCTINSYFQFFFITNAESSPKTISAFDINSLITTNLFEVMKSKEAEDKNWALFKVSSKLMLRQCLGLFTGCNKFHVRGVFTVRKKICQI